MLRFLLLFVLVVIVARAFWRLVDGVVEGMRGRRRQAATPAQRRARWCAIRCAARSSCRERAVTLG